MDDGECALYPAALLLPMLPQAVKIECSASEEVPFGKTFMLASRPVDAPTKSPAGFGWALVESGPRRYGATNWVEWFP